VEIEIKLHRAATRASTQKKSDLKGDQTNWRQKRTGRGNPRAAALARGEINQLGFDYATEQQKTQQKIAEQRITDEQARRTGKQGSGCAENESLVENTARPKTTAEVRRRRRTRGQIQTEGDWELAGKHEKEKSFTQTENSRGFHICQRQSSTPKIKLDLDRKRKQIPDLGLLTAQQKANNFFMEI
jgi:hypothetical protein